MAKGFRLRVGQSAGRLSKVGRGNRMARSSSSMAMEWIRDLCYDDYDESDWEWGSIPRFSRATAGAADQLSDLSDSNYGPWEEVHEDSNAMDLEDQEETHASCAPGKKCTVCEGFSWNDHGVIELGTFKRVDCESHGVSPLKVGPNDCGGAFVASCVDSGSPSPTSKSVKVEDVDKGMGSYGQVKRHHPPVNGHRKKKVIMGRDFLIINRDCLRELKRGRRFQFFHKQSLSVVVVKVQEQAPTDLNSFDIPVTGQEHISVVKEVDEPMDSGTATQNPIQVEDDSTSPTSCVSSVSMPDSFQSSSEEASSSWVAEEFQGIVGGIRNLRSKRVMALRRYRPEVCGPISVMQLDNRKKKTVDRIKVGGSYNKTLITPIGIKRKRERVIEDSYDDPHIFRCPQRRVLH